MRQLILALLLSLSFAANSRETLTGDAVYYVSNTGHNANDGRSPSSAWATPQHAWDVIQKTLDLSCHKVRVNLSGAFPPLVASGRLVGACTLDAVTFYGNKDHPNEVTIDATGVNAITVKAGAWLKLDGLLLSATQPSDPVSFGRCLVVYEGARVVLGTMAWHVCELAHITVVDAEIHAEFSSQYITGTSQSFAIVEVGGKLWLNGAWITPLVPQYFPLGMFHVTQLALLDLSGTILNNIAPVAGPAYKVKSGALLIRLGMLLPGLSSGQVEASGIVIP